MQELNEDISERHKVPSGAKKRNSVLIDLMFKYRKKEHFLVSFIFISSDAYKRFRVDFFPDFTSESVLELAQCHEISLTLFQEVPAGHMMIIISFPQLLHPVRL